MKDKAREYLIDKGLDDYQDILSNSQGHTEGRDLSDMLADFAETQLKEQRVKVSELISKYEAKFSRSRNDVTDECYSLFLEELKAINPPKA